MSCSAAAGSLASATVHRGELTRFLARPLWQKIDFNAPLRKALLAQEAGRGRFVRLTFCFFARREDFEQKQTQGTKGRDPSDFDGLAKVASRLNPLFPSVQDWVAAQGRAGFIVDATLVSRERRLRTRTASVASTMNTGHRLRRPQQGRRDNAKKVVRQKCHSVTFGLLITPSGIRIPFQIPHDTKEYCREQGITHRTTAESAAELIRDLPLPAGAEVVVLGDTAYDADVVQQACRERGDIGIVPANPERVDEGSQGHRPQERSRLKDGTRLSLTQPTDQGRQPQGFRGE